MTSPPEAIQVRCPGCGTDYDDWWRPSINMMLDDFDDDYLEEASTSTCPSCGLKVRHDVLVVRKDGVWELSDDDRSSDPADQEEPLG